MKPLSAFNIDIYNLKNGTHQYEFVFDDSFFGHFPYGLTESGAGKVSVSLNKGLTLIEVSIGITGTVVLICDRSLEKFDFPIEAEREVIYKFGDEEKELSDEIFMIPRDAQTLNLAQLIYEFIALEIPFKKLHPKFKGEKWNDEEGKIVYRSEKNVEQPEASDPRWSALKKLRE